MLALIALLIALGLLAALLLSYRIRACVRNAKGSEEPEFTGPDEDGWFTVTQFESGWRNAIPSAFSGLLIIRRDRLAWSGTAPAPVVVPLGGLVGSGPIYCGTKRAPRIYVEGGIPTEDEG